MSSLVDRSLCSLGMRFTMHPTVSSAQQFRTGQTVATWALHLMSVSPVAAATRRGRAVRHATSPGKASPWKPCTSSLATTLILGTLHWLREHVLSTQFGCEAQRRPPNLGLRLSVAPAFSTSSMLALYISVFVYLFYSAQVGGGRVLRHVLPSCCFRRRADGRPGPAWESGCSGSPTLSSPA